MPAAPSPPDEFWPGIDRLWAVRSGPEVVRTGAVDRRTAATLVVGALAGCAAIALVDLAEPSPYPACPSAALLGIDCPACGTLRGLHALSRGRLLDALGHNLLLAVAVPIAVLGLWRWARIAAGRAVSPRAWPRWTLPAALVMAGAFTVARNLPVDAFAWLAAA